MYFGKLCVEAGLPPGVVNVVPGIGSMTGKALAEHLEVDKIAFTGSTNTGRQIMRSAATNLKNITLECGGKSPLLVFEDADLEEAVKWAHSGIMDNSGQVCTSTSRIYVQEKVYKDFVQRLAEFTKRNTIVGGAFDKDVSHGPQVSRVQYDRVLSFMEQGKKSGVHIQLGGNQIQRDGYFIEPTIFTDVRSSRIQERPGC